MTAPAATLSPDLHTTPATAALRQARAGWASAQAVLHAALVEAITVAAHAVTPHAAQVAFCTDTDTPPRLLRVDLADDHDVALAHLHAGDPGFTDLAELHAELVDVTGDLEAEIDLAVAG